MSGGAQQAHERVTQNGVAQVADVRGLVRIDAGVLDQYLAAHVGRALAVMAGDGAGACAGQRFAAARRASGGH